jgi:integrase
VVQTRPASKVLLVDESRRVLLAQLGHSSIAVTGDIYQHVTDELGSDAAARMAELYDVGT